MPMPGWADPRPERVTLRASRVIAGSDARLLHDAAVAIENAKIVSVGPSTELPRVNSEKAVDVDLGNVTMLPGLIDVHTHLMLGAGTEDRSLPEVMASDSNDLMLARALRNALIHMLVGVTTLRDCGCRDRVALSARDVINQGVFPGPRILASGRPITVTGGHLYFCNGEADGVQGVQKLARELNKEGADFFKVMASGGNSTPTTDARHCAYTAEELAAIVSEAHRVGKLTTAHCLSKKSIRNAIAGGLDMIEHCFFVDERDGEHGYDEAAVAEIVRKGIYVSPCIQTNWRQYEQLKARESELSPAEAAKMGKIERKTSSRLLSLQRMHHAGVKIVAGTDAMSTFGDFALGLKMMVQAGLTPQEAVLSATSKAAKAIGISDLTGALVPGLEADIIACGGNPLEDVSALERPLMVIRGGSPFLVPETISDRVSVGVLLHPAG